MSKYQRQSLEDIISQASPQNSPLVASFDKSLLNQQLRNSLAGRITGVTGISGVSGVKISKHEFASWPIEGPINKDCPELKRLLKGKVWKK